MTLQDFINALNARFPGKVHAVDQGRKYARVTREYYGQRHAYCFVDGDGNIYKADGWNRPAKGVRNTLAKVDVNKIDEYTGWLYAR